MAKKKVAKKSSSKKSTWDDIWEKYKYEMVPGMIGGVIALLFSGSLQLGLLVFLAVVVGSWVGHKMLGEKK